MPHTETNPLLERAVPIPFHRIGPEHIVPGIRAALAEATAELDALIADKAQRSYTGTVARLEEITERLARAIRPASTLVTVMNTPEMRAAYDTVVPEFSAFFARIPLNAGLWAAVREAAESPEAGALTGVRRRHLEKTLRAFRRAGADLPDATKARVEALRVELSTLQTDFANNVLDSTNAWELVLTEPDAVAGLPESSLAQARASAQAKGVEGWRFTLQQPSVQPFLQYAERRDLREQVYRAYVNRACEPPHDNRPLVGRILSLRRELAGLLGFRDWADYELEENMAHTGERAIRFERELTERTRPHWQREMDALEEFARGALGLDRLEPWDVAFVTERMRRDRFDLDAEELRPFFPMDRVLEGLFEITRRLFGLVVSERKVPEVWHPEVRFYDVVDELEGRRVGGFYTDWFPRETKRGGAWMSGLVTGGPDAAGGWEEHLGLITGNLSPPEGDRPALLTHREVETVFHEFGHLLHHLLSRVEVRSMGGTHVAVDWVELPSQIMENWTWERPALDLFARHWETGEAIPEPLFAKMQAARSFMGAHQQMRQLAFGTLDLTLHVEFDPAGGGDAVAAAQGVMRQFAPRPHFEDDHFVTGFTHIFAGGYAAGYYSYLWSEVLDADAFSRFAREGLFSRETGRAFVDAVLSRGDSEEPEVLFREFMGRDPDPEALIRRNLGEREAAG